MVRSSATAITPDIGDSSSDADMVSSIAALNGDGAAALSAATRIPLTAPPVAPVLAPRAGLVRSHAAIAGIIRDLTYHGLARATGLSRSHITGVLKGRRECTVGYAAKIAQALGVGANELLGYVAAQKAQGGSAAARPGRRKSAGKSTKSTRSTTP